MDLELILREFCLPMVEAADVHKRLADFQNPKLYPIWSSQWGKLSVAALYEADIRGVTEYVQHRIRIAALEAEHAAVRCESTTCYYRRGVTGRGRQAGLWSP